MFFFPLSRYIDRRDFQYIEMDTDSAYMALSGPLHLIVKPEMRLDFWNSYEKWFPKPFCDTHRASFIATKMEEYRGGVEWQPLPCCQAVTQFHTRTPGLFKVEFEGNGMVALNSKTYCCWGDRGSKYSSKGLSKKTNSFDKNHFLSVLNDKSCVGGINKGFAVKDNNMYIYEQIRTGLTYRYAKRLVLADGIGTTSLSI